MLSQVSLTVAEGQSLALLGRNGMGKTTLVNSMVGVTRYFGGAIRLDGRDITGLRADQRAHAGVGWVPQERNIFKSLTVDENLTAVARPGPWTTGKVYAMFPRLEERRAQSRQPAVRRRAADAGGRPRADPQSAHHPARRAARRPRTDHRRGAAGGAAAHHPRGGLVGDPGRAECQEDPRRHRPRRDHRARRHRASGRQRGARQGPRRCWRSISASRRASAWCRDGGDS